MPATLDQAIAAVRVAHGEEQWLALDANEQTRAIYREMRRLDLEETMTRRALARAAAARAVPVPPRAGAGAPGTTEPLRCSAFIKTRSGDRCTWQPVVVHDGQAYCGFHNPLRNRIVRGRALPDPLPEPSAGIADPAPSANGT